MSATESFSSRSGDEMTSPSLLARVRREDADAWSELVDLYASLIANWCGRRGLTDDDASEVIQTVFMSVARGLGTYQNKSGRDGSFRAWLWTITRNRIIDHVRARPADAPVGGSSNARRLNEHAGLAECEDDESTSDLELHQLLHRALEQIETTVAPQTWRAFWRCVVDGQSTDVVSAESGLSVASVRQARSRVLRRLREQLGDC